MTIENLQSALLLWFWQEPAKRRSLPEIENRCFNLANQFDLGSSFTPPKYVLFYPLVRFGFIEFYGEAQFALAPTCALRKGNLVLLVNLPSGLLGELATTDTPVSAILGYGLYRASGSLLTFLKEKQVPNRPFDLGAVLGRLSPLLKVIRSWEADTVIDPARFLFFEQQWIPSPKAAPPGIYKKSAMAYAQRVCRLGDNEWHVIPSADKNIDAFSYAVLWKRSHISKSLNAAYQAGRSQLTLGEAFFPLTLERLLIINTLLHPEGCRAIDQRHYHLDKDEFRIFNRFLDHSIKIIYE